MQGNKNALNKKSHTNKALSGLYIMLESTSLNNEELMQNPVNEELQV